MPEGLKKDIALQPNERELLEAKHGRKGTHTKPTVTAKPAGASKGKKRARGSQSGDIWTREETCGRLLNFLDIPPVRRRIRRARPFTGGRPRRPDGVLIACWRTMAQGTLRPGPREAWRPYSAARGSWPPSSF